MDQGWGEFPADEPADGANAAISTGDPRERRLQIRAYNHWVSILDGRDFPSIDDLDLNAVDFGPRSFVLDCTIGVDNPAITFIGSELREASQLGYKVQYIADIPRRSLLSRLSDHYLQIIANRAPVGFEAEFEDERGVNLLYRGILMPFSSTGDTIDFLYGVINWKEGCADTADEAFEPATGRLELSEPEPREEFAAECADEDEVALEPEQMLGDDAGLADRLSLAREGAHASKSADGRSRIALYQALGLAYDFALAAEANADEYAEMLQDSGVKMQARAPMTPVVKLIFGVDYDKARLTEFAAALSYGRRHDLAPGGFTDYLSGFSGGLKAMVQAERRQRKPVAAVPKEDGREALLASRAIAYIDLPLGDEDFVLLVARREADGRLAVVASVDAGEAFVDRALRKAVLPEPAHQPVPRSRAA